MYVSFRPTYACTTLLACLIVTILLAKLHSRSDGADVAGMDKNLCEKAYRVQSRVHILATFPSHQWV